jgi:hypothetical protein
LPGQKLLAGCKRLGAETNRLDEILDGLSHAAIVVDDEHGGNGRGFHT